ncbi:MAG: hypothetical protein WA160_13665 [Pseudobdellovibrio sp.]
MARKIIIIIIGIVVTIVLKNKTNSHAEIIGKDKITAAHFNAKDFIDWYKQSEICKINSFYKSAPWDNKNQILDVSLYQEALDILTSKVPLGSEDQSNVNIFLDFHKRRNNGEVWESLAKEEEIITWKKEHSGAPAPAGLGDLHWVEGLMTML